MSSNVDQHSSLSIENRAIDSVTNADSQAKSKSGVQKDADTERTNLTVTGPPASSREKPNDDSPANNPTVPVAEGTSKGDWDLSVEADVIRYLASTPFACTDIKTLSGGNTNFVYRLTLAQPYKGHATLVLKHAKGFVKVNPAFALHLTRQKYEVEALRHVFAWLPSDWLVRVPEVHWFDEPENAVIMDDTGEGSITLKEFLQKGHATPEIAKVIGTELGRFLAGLHSWGKGNVDVQKAVAGNVEGKALKATYYYGWLKSTLEGPSYIPFLNDPPLDVTKEDMEAIERLSAETMKAIEESKGTFVMGDFWPGNIMIKVEDGRLKHITVVDWELAKEGILGIDVGQFSAELHLLRRCNAETCQETASIVLDNFLSEYKAEYGPNTEDARRAISQVGAHMVILGARVNWGPRDISRQVVLEGVRILVDGYSSQGPSELNKTIIGGML